MYVNMQPINLSNRTPMLAMMLFLVQGLKVSETQVIATVQIGNYALSNDIYTRV